MNELLKKLLAAEVLTEETRSELETAFASQLDEAMKSAKADAHATVTAELNEAWLTERDTLIEAVDSKVTEAMLTELNELREDIARFRDLEAESAIKLVEAKSEMAIQLKSEIAQLIEKVDNFLEFRIATEMEELREDIAEAKKNEFGKKIFESFVSEFKTHYADDDSTEAKLNESELRLQDTIHALEEAEKKAAKLERSIKLEKVLTPLTGKTREVMEAILKSVDTSMLEESYKAYVGRVLKGTAQPEVQTSEKENKVLAEGKTVVLQGSVKTGDDQTQRHVEQVMEEADIVQTGLSDAERTRLRTLAGL